MTRKQGKHTVKTPMWIGSPSSQLISKIPTCKFKITEGQTAHQEENAGNRDKISFFGFSINKNKNARMTS